MNKICCKYITGWSGATIDHLSFSNIRFIRNERIREWAISTQSTIHHNQNERFVLFISLSPVKQVGGNQHQRQLLDRTRSTRKIGWLLFIYSALSLDGSSEIVFLFLFPACDGTTRNQSEIGEGDHRLVWYQIKAASSQHDPAIRSSSSLVIGNQSRDNMFTTQHTHTKEVLGSERNGSYKFVRPLGFHTK